MSSRHFGVEPSRKAEQDLLYAKSLGARGADGVRVHVGVGVGAGVLEAWGVRVAGSGGAGYSGRVAGSPVITA
jgi:hypothetical protein